MNRVINEHIIKEDVKEIMIRFGGFVYGKRNAEGITLKQLSQSTGLSIGAISEIEAYAKDDKNKKGDNETKEDKERIKIPSLYTIIALAKALDIDLSVFNEVLQSSDKKKIEKNNREATLRDTLKQLNIPNKAISHIMSYVNILSNIGDLYDLQNLDRVPSIDKKVQQRQNELLKIYSQMCRENP